MITTDGTVYIKRYLAGLVPSLGQAIAFGIGPLAETAGSTKLQFEVDRSDIAIKAYDFVNNKVIFKAPVPESFGGTIYEVGLYSMSADSLAGQFGSRLLTSFDSDTEFWVDATTGAEATYSSTASRIGADGVIHTPAASGTKTDSLQEVFIDLSGHSSADRFVFAFNAGNGNTTSIKFRFATDTSNYYEFTLGAQTTGYKIVEATKGSAVVTGTPDWGNITEIRATTNSGGGGASSITYDGIRIDDADTNNPNYVLIAREVLPTPFVKEVGKVQDIEFTLDANIT